MDYDQKSIIQRMKQALDVDKDIEIAEYFQISKGAVGNWKTNGVSDAVIISFCLENNISLQWLLLGYGEMREKNPYCVDKDLILDFPYIGGFIQACKDRDVKLMRVLAGQVIKSLDS